VEQTIQKPSLLSLTVEELEEWMLAEGEAKYRAKQIFPQLHRGISPDEMTNLGKKLQNTGILTGRSPERLSKLLILKHRLIDHARQRRILLSSKLLQLCSNIIGKYFAEIIDKISDCVGHSFSKNFSVHNLSLQLCLFVKNYIIILYFFNHFSKKL